MAQRWVAAVLRHETNTFSPITTPVKDFGRVGPTDGPARGEDTFRFYRNTNNPVAAYIDLAEEATAQQYDHAAKRNTKGWFADVIVRTARRA